MNDDSYKISTYWDLSSIVPFDISFEDAKNKLHQLLTDSIRIRLRSDVPIGIFLSGGIDSALVAAISSKISKETINTFTIGFDEKNMMNQSFDKLQASFIKSNHKIKFIRPQDLIKQIENMVKAYGEPFADSSAISSLILSDFVKKDVTVALSGDGGDESFFGYKFFDYVSVYKYIFLIPKFIRLFISNILLIFKK